MTSFNLHLGSVFISTNVFCNDCSVYSTIVSIRVFTALVVYSSLPCDAPSRRALWRSSSRLLLLFRTSSVWGVYEADCCPMFALQWYLIFAYSIYRIFYPFLLLSCPFFPSQIVSVFNLFDSPFDVVVPFLSVIENVRNRFPNIFLFLALADEKYVFAVLCFKTNSWLYCLFLFIVADPYKRQERPRVVICPQKEQNLVASLLWPLRNCLLESIKKDSEKFVFFFKPNFA